MTSKPIAGQTGLHPLILVLAILLGHNATAETLKNEPLIADSLEIVIIPDTVDFRKPPNKDEFLRTGCHFSTDDPSLIAKMTEIVSTSKLPETYKSKNFWPATAAIFRLKGEVLSSVFLERLQTSGKIVGQTYNNTAMQKYFLYPIAVHDIIRLELKNEKYRSIDHTASMNCRPS